MKDKKIQEVMTNIEAMAWKAFANFVMNFLGDHKSQNYVQKLVDTLTSIQSFGSVSRELGQHDR